MTTRELTTAPHRPPSLYDLTFAEIEAALARDGVSPIHAKVLWRALHRHLNLPPWTGEPLPPPLGRWLAEHVGDSRAYSCRRPAVAREVVSEDETRKFLLAMWDGNAVETVLMGYPGRFTACVSTQVGCAMGCVFCATGQSGFTRHLAPGEIVAQVLHCQRELRAAGKSGLRNLVLMGMGEPLHNYDAVMTALATVSDRRGASIGPSRISISTVGVVPGIVRLADERQPYHLAVSLHGATEENRAALVPVARRWPLAELIEACRYYSRSTDRRIFFEWTLIAGVNDSPAHARQIGVLLRGIDSHVNLIPLNQTAAFHGGASDAGTIDTFQRELRAAGIPSTVRQRRGIDVAAGCGQLRAAK